MNNYWFNHYLFKCSLSPPIFMLLDAKLSSYFFPLFDIVVYGRAGYKLWGVQKWCDISRWVEKVKRIPDMSICFCLVYLVLVSVPINLWSFPMLYWIVWFFFSVLNGGNWWPISVVTGKTQGGSSYLLVQVRAFPYLLQILISWNLPRQVECKFMN